MRAVNYNPSLLVNLEHLKVLHRFIMAMLMIGGLFILVYTLIIYVAVPQSDYLDTIAMVCVLFIVFLIVAMLFVEGRMDYLIRRQDSDDGTV